MSDSQEMNFYSPDAPQRVGPLARLGPLLDEFGVRIEIALEGTGIPPSAFDDSENRFSYRQLSRVLERSAAMTQCPHLGLLLGSRSDHRDLGFPGRLIANAPTLEVALSALVRVQQLNSRGAAVYLRRSGERWVLGYGVYEPETVAQEQIYPLVMALVANLVRALTGGAVMPLEVHLPIRKPDNVGPYTAHFRAPVHFNQSEAGIILARSALDASIRGAKPLEFDRLCQQIARQMPTNETVWTERVMHAMRPLILRGEPTTMAMADVQGLSLRRLTRRLEQEDTTFQTLLDRVRYSMARELLLLTELTVGDVADALSYTHQSTFAAAFRRWSGMTSTEWRGRARAETVVAV